MKDLEKRLADARVAVEDAEARVLDQRAKIVELDAAEAACAAELREGYSRDDGECVVMARRKRRAARLEADDLHSEIKLLEDMVADRKTDEQQARIALERERRRGYVEEAKVLGEELRVGLTASRDLMSKMAALESVESRSRDTVRLIDHEPLGPRPVQAAGFPSGLWSELKRTLERTDREL